VVDIPHTLTRQRALMLTFTALVIVYLIWNVAALAPLAYPFRLFVTYVHEAGHSLMALLSGGKVVEFNVSPDGTGLARTVGGSRALILPAGYLGAAFFGAVLFFLVNTTRRTRTLSIVLGIGLVLLTIAYARPGDDGAWTAIIIGLLMGLALIGTGWRFSSELNLLVLSVLAIMTALNAVLDITLLVRYADLEMVTKNGIVRNDAAAFHAEVASFLPASAWALLWAAIAVLMIGTSVYYSVLRPLFSDDDSRHRSEDVEIDFSQFT
jgi:hypothetical protein